MKRHLAGLTVVLALCSLSAALPRARAELKFHLATTAGLTLSHNPVHPGEPLTLTGRVEDAGGRPVSLGWVRLELADAPEGPWTALDQGVPDEAGEFQAVDYTLGLETRPIYVRLAYLGGEAGGAVYGAAASPAIPVIAQPRAASPGGVALGFVKAKGDGGRAGPWEFTVKVRARQDVDGVMLQGSTGDWTLLAGGAWDFRADTGRVAARVLEDERGETLISWQVGSLAAGQEATLTIRVDGIAATGEGEGDGPLPLNGAEAMGFSAVCRAAANQGRGWEEVRPPAPEAGT
jgi:hypothetical protein